MATSSSNAAVNQRFFLNLFPGRVAGRSRPVGEAAVNAKLDLETSGLNQRRFALHGDPALALLAPRNQVRLSLHGRLEGTAWNDTLWRGRVAELRGRLVDLTGNPMPDFNGTATVPPSGAV